MYCLRGFAKHYYDRFHNPERLFTETKLGFLVLPLLLLFLLFIYFSFEQLIRLRCESRDGAGHGDVRWYSVCLRKARR